MRTWARMQSKTGKSKVFVYYFSHVPPGPNAARMGAQHGAEIPYAFNWANGKNSTSWQDYDRKLAEAVSAYWVNFAATGDPNGRGLLKWPAYHIANDQVMGLGDKIELEPVPHKPALDFLDGYYDRLRQSGKSE
jgi:para-nitrobenzyl esterase